MLRKFTSISALAMLCVTVPAIAASGAPAATTAPATPDLATFRKNLDSFIETQMREQKIPGVAVAVLHKGQIVTARGYGRADVENDVPVTNDTIFQSGSIGKMFTAAAVMSMVEQGKIGLDDPISKYLPDTPASWKPITVRHLMTHTAGVSEFGMAFDYRRDYSDDELVKAAASRPLDFKPGSRWAYSNAGYIVLGIVVKKATGKSYLDILDTQIFKPTGMKTARGISDGDIVRHRASGYQLVGGELKNDDFVSPTMNSTADGSLYVSLNDMIAWARGVEKGTALSPASWKQIYTPVRLNSGKTYPYGFGWMLENAGGRPRYHHAGAWQGFKTHYSRYLGNDLSVILLTNLVATDHEVITDGIAGLWDPALTAPGPKPAREPDTDRRISALIEKARTGTLRNDDLVYMNSEFLGFGNSAWPEQLKSLGALKALEIVKRTEAGDDVEYIYKASFDSGSVKMQLWVGPDGRPSLFFIY